MQLHLQHLVPHPLQEHNLETSDIWAKEWVLPAGALVFLRAPSGKGKSTLMHILYGLRHDFTGDASWGQVAVTKADARQWADWRSRQLSLVFQDLRLFSDLTVAENIMLKQSLNPDVEEVEIRDWMRYLGLDGKWQQPAGTLSYGERQRVAIIRSLLQPFSWLLLDEPFSHLDKENAGKAAELIHKRVVQNNAGLLLVDLEAMDWFPFTHKLVL